MPSVSWWWFIGSETLKSLLALAIALGLIVLPFAAWGVMWKLYALTERSDQEDIYRILENQRLDDLLESQREKEAQS